MNTTAILREDALYKYKQLQEKQPLEHHERKLRDGFDFFKWQKQKKEDAIVGELFFEVFLLKMQDKMELN